jgi:hypothetical protein
MTHQWPRADNRVFFRIGLSGSGIAPWSAAAKVNAVPIIASPTGSNRACVSFTKRLAERGAPSRAYSNLASRGFATASVVIAASLLAGCTGKSPQRTTTETGANVITAPTQTTDAAVVEPKVASAEPDDEFYDACVVGSFPAGRGLVRLVDVRVGDFVAQVTSGTDDFGWEPAGDRQFVLRINRRNQLTNETHSFAWMLRQVNAAPRKNTGCGPRWVVAEGFAVDGQEIDPVRLYAMTKEGAKLSAQRALTADPRPYSPPVSTAGDGPYTDVIQTEIGAANAALAREMGQ